MTGADVNSEASILAALPFDVFRETVVADLILEDGSQPALFQTGRCYKFFKYLVKAYSSSPSPHLQLLSLHRLRPRPSWSPWPMRLTASSFATTWIRRLWAPSSCFQSKTCRISVITSSHAQVRCRVLKSGFQTNSFHSAMAHHHRSRDGGRICPPFA